MAYTVKKVTFFIMGLVALSLLFYSRTKGFRKGLPETAAQTILYPFIYTAHAISSYTTKLITQKLSYQELEEKYKKLNHEYSTLLDEFIILNAAKNHFTTTQELRDFKSRYNFSAAHLTKVIAKHFSDASHYLLVNKGSIHGIKPNMIAIYKLQIVGYVVDVSPAYSKILCITDQHCKIAAFTNSTNAQGILVGTNHPNRCNLEYVDHLSTIKNNDLVFSSGQGTIFPEGFCVGKIMHHEVKEKALYQEVHLEPLIDLTSLDFCLLISNERVAFY